MSQGSPQQPVDSELIHHLPARPLSDEERAALRARITGIESRPLSDVLEDVFSSLIILRDSIPRAATLTARLKQGQAVIDAAHLSLFLTLSLQVDGRPSRQHWQLSPEGIQLLFLIAPMESLRISEALDD